VIFYFSGEGSVAELYHIGTKPATVQLYGSHLSTCTQRVEVVLKEKGVPYEFHPIDMRAGEHKTEEWLEKQPFGQVPYLEDGNFTLFESRAIGRYISVKYPFSGTRLVPFANLTYNAKFEQAASIELQDFDPYASGLLMELVYKSGEPDLARVETLKGQFEKKLAAYERILSKQRYLAGNYITAADLFHLPQGTALIRKINLEWYAPFPSVERWWKEISARQSWSEVVAQVYNT